MTSLDRPVTCPVGPSAHLPAGPGCLTEAAAHLRQAVVLVPGNAAYGADLRLVAPAVP